MKKRIKGFTIAELLIVIVIIATFALLSYFGFHRLKDKSFNDHNKNEAEAILAAINEIYTTGISSQGVQGEKAQILDVKSACADNAKFFKDIASKHTNISDDVEILVLENKEYPYTSYEYCLSNADIQNDGTIQPKNKRTILNETTRLFSCSSEEFVNPYGQDKKTYIIYHPITSYHSAKYNCASGNWQHGDGWGSCSGSQRNKYCYDKDKILDPAVLANIAGLQPPDCVYFNLYYIKKDGGKYTISENINIRK